MGKERRPFLFLSIAFLPQAHTYTNTPSLPISCTYSIHPPTLKGAWRASTHLLPSLPSSLLFSLSFFLSLTICLSTSLSFSLSLSLSLSHTHTHTHTLPSLCFLIKFTVNQITPPCNKLQTWEQRRRDRDRGGKRRRRMELGCSNVRKQGGRQGRMINYLRMGRERELNHIHVDVCKAACTCTYKWHTHAQCHDTH